MTNPITDERLAEARDYTWLDGDLVASLIARIDVAEEKLAASEADHGETSGKLADLQQWMHEIQEGGRQ